MMGLKSTATVVTAFVLLSCCYVAARVLFVDLPQHKLLSGSCVLQKCSRSRYPTIINSSDKNNDSELDSENIRSDTEDLDGVPIFDTNKRVTFFGLEPNDELNPLDNSLQFTAPIILFLSIYVTLSLFFSGDGDLVLFDNL